MRHVRLTRWGSLICLMLLGGCTGDAGRVRSDGDPALPTDGGTPACSTTGAAASCDPITGTGCGSAASCYLVKSQGPSCVCPGGSTGEGNACNTTIECAPGLVCAGSAAPGACRKVCDPSGNDCLNGEFCRAITALPSHGYCDIATR